MNKKLRSVVMTFTYLPMINPEIITGVALMLLFIYLKMEFGMQTLIVAHITFNVPLCHPERAAQTAADGQKYLMRRWIWAAIRSKPSPRWSSGDYARHRVRLFDGADLLDG